jgi:pimeloyl-ACP methyl ester carboxylesterase
MNKSAFVIAIALALTSTGSASNALSTVQNGSPVTPAAETAFTEEPITLETPTGTLYGTLDRPHSASPVPVALIIAGSGPTDRDGNSAMLKGANNSLKLLAEGLAARGIASVRYDKRGIGETGKAMWLAAEKAKTLLREDDLRFEIYIDDAVLWGKKLRGNPGFSSLTVIGHSEGSLIGMVAAQRMGANGYVSIAGAGRPAQQFILEQIKSQLPPGLLKPSEDILGQLAAGKTVESVPAALNVLFRPSVQPYLISWFRYDPADEIAKLRVPVLIVQGTTDMQASLRDAKALATANSAATLLLVDGMNHVLKTVPDDRDQQVSSYSDPALAVAPRLIAEISRFVNEAFADKASAEDVPMLFRGSMPAVEVMVNGQGPFLFAIDTGANDLARVDSSLVERLGLQIKGKSRTGDLSARSTELDTVRVDSITLGSLQFRNVKALSRNYNRIPNLPRIDGILCFDLFSGFLLTLDYPAKRVRVEPGDLPQADGGEILNLRSTSGLPAIDLIVGGFKVNALIDSGNLADGIVLPGSLVEKLELASPPAPYRTLKTSSSEIEAKKARLKQSIRLGRHEFAEAQIIFPNLSNNASIGSEVLSEFAITFDQKNHRVRFIRGDGALKRQ